MVECDIIRFQCPSCDVHIRVPDEHAGKRGKCPKCRQRVTVPAFQDPPDDPLRLEPLDAPVAPVPPADDPVPSDYEVFDGADTTTTQTGQRTYAWPIDILLYPMNQAGFIHLAIFVGIPLLLGLIQMILGPLGFFVGIASFFIGIAVGLYYYWYISECVNDSAGGGTRAPAAFSSDSLSEQFTLFLHLAATYIMFAGPAFFYHLYLHQMDALFWWLAAYGVVMFPMGLLAMVLYQDTSALNPFKLLLAILKCFFPYLGLMVLLAGVLVLFAGLSHIPILGEFLWVYGSFILAHLLGRFYWKNQARIGWF